MDISKINQTPIVNETTSKSSQEEKTFSDVANSIFTQEKYKNLDKNEVNKIISGSDTNPKDGKINDKEMQNISEEVAKLYQSSVNQTNNVSPEVKQEVDAFKNMTPEQQAEYIKDELEKLGENGNHLSFDGESISIMTSDGEVQKISLKGLGFPDDMIGRLSPVISNTIDKINNINTQKDNLNKILNDYMAQGYYPVGTPVENEEGNLIGELQNDKGDTLKINLNTAEIIQEKKDE